MARGRDYSAEKPHDPVFPSPAPEREHEDSPQTPRGRGAASGEHEFLEPNPRLVQRDRERSYNIRDSEIQTLAEIGTFRTLAVEDLARFRYAGDREEAQAEIRNLTRQGLIRVRTAHPTRVVYVALTREGHRFLKQHRPVGVNPSQVFYSRFVKPREVKHDAALYRLYQEAAQRITRDGGKIKRVVLDFELKKSINAKLAKLSSLAETEQGRRKREIAEEHGLAVVNSKIPLPDLRVEYETVEREQTKVDLELATSDYHGESLAAKVRAGFAIFALREDAALLRRAIGDPELTRDIFSI
jgi:DNA-binding MarR family transcriptional regulator